MLSPQQQAWKERDAAVMEAARVLYLREGYHGLTMARVGAAANVPKGTL